MLLNLLFILPQVFKMGNDIIKCLDGDVTEDEWNAVVQDMYDMSMNIPQLQGFVAIFQVVANIAKASFPIIDNLDSTDENAVNAAVKSLPATTRGGTEMTAADIIRAKNAIDLMNDVALKIKATSEAKPDIDPEESDEFIP